MKRSIVTTTVLVLVFAASTAAGQQVHAVIVGDASPAASWGKLRPNITMDVIAVSAVFWNNIPSDKLKLVPLTIENDERAEPEVILNVLDELHPQPEDTLVFYYSGHGAADDRGHYFALAGGRLYREQVRERMVRTKARLVVLLTDCCNVRSDGQRYVAPAPQIAPPRIMSPVLRSLLLQASGVVDINASSPNESAFFTPNSDQPGVMPGSIFTKALTEYVAENRANTPNWDDLLRSVSFRVHLVFRQGYPNGASAAKGTAAQTDQNVYALDYPGMPERTGPRTGVTVRDHNGQGALITNVRADYPAGRIYDLAGRRYVAMQPDQLIVAANGQTVRSADDFLKIVRESPQVMRLTITEGRSQQRDVLIRLRY